MYFIQIISIFLLSTLLNGLAIADVGQIGNEQLKKMINDNVVLVDIRRKEEWKQTGVIKGSHLITFFDKKGNYDIKKWLDEFNKIVKKDQPFVLICRTGNRTGMVTKFLDGKLHYRQVNHLQKGISHWIKRGNKTVKPQ